MITIYNEDKRTHNVEFELDGIEFENGNVEASSNGLPTVTLTAGGASSPARAVKSAQKP